MLHQRAQVTPRRSWWSRAALVLAGALLPFAAVACDDGGELADYDPGGEGSTATAPSGVEPAAPFGVGSGDAPGGGFSPGEPGGSDPRRAGAEPEALAPTETVPAGPYGGEGPVERGEAGRVDPLEGGVGGGIDTTS